MGIETTNGNAAKEERGGNVNYVKLGGKCLVQFKGHAMEERNEKTCRIRRAFSEVSLRSDGHE